MKFHELHLPLLAQSDPHRTTSSGVPNNDHGTKPVWYFDDMALVAGTGLTIMILLALAAYWRRGKHGESRDSRSFRSIPDARSMTTPLSEDDSRKKRRRRRKRDHRPRNPSLSETGGFPSSEELN